MAISARTVRVTPKIAADYLTHNVKNRKLKRKQIEKYARDMAAGDWLETGEAIKFDEDGNLLDGQNRLNAIILAETTLPLLVIRGLPAKSQDVMDSGVPRSNGDMFALHGYVNSHNLAGAANVFAAWDAGELTNAMQQNAKKLTQSEALTLVRKHPGLAKSTLTAHNIIYKRLRMPVGSLATAHYTLRELDEVACDTFFRRIDNYETTGAGDPIATLLKRVADERQNRVRIWPSTALFYMFRSWNAYRDGERLDRLLIGAPGRWQPIPQPK